MSKHSGVRSNGDSVLNSGPETLWIMAAASGGASDLTEGGAAAVKAGLAQLRQYGSKSGGTIAFLVARRKVPGEKPPPSRDGG